MLRRLSSVAIKANNLLQYVPVRTAKKELPFVWARPERVRAFKPEKAGDLESLKEMDLKRLMPLYEKSEELKTADENVKKLYTLEFQTKRYIYDHMKLDYVKSVQDHKFDTKSSAARIARMTAVIRQYQKHMETCAKKPLRKRRVYMNKIIQLRKKELRYLRLRDYRLFEWLLEKLNICYKPHPYPQPSPVQRKRALRKLTDEYCENFRKQRLNEYKAKLDSEKEDFLKKKVEKLQWIKQKESELNIVPTITDEDISVVSKQLEEFQFKNKKEEGVD